MRVRRLESEVEQERAISVVRPFVLGGLGEGEKVVELDEQLEEELSSEMRVRDLCMEVHSTIEPQRFIESVYLEIEQIRTGEILSEVVFAIGSAV